MFRLGTSKEFTGSKKGRLVEYGGFVFRVPYEFTHIKSVEEKDKILVCAFNEENQYHLGIFNSMNYTDDSTTIQISEDNLIE